MKDRDRDYRGRCLVRASIEILVIAEIRVLFWNRLEWCKLDRDCLDYPDRFLVRAAIDILVIAVIRVLFNRLVS